MVNLNGVTNISHLLAISHYSSVLNWKGTNKRGESDKLFQFYKGEEDLHKLVLFDN